MKKQTTELEDLTLSEHGAILTPGDDGSVSIIHGGEVLPSEVGEVQKSEKITIVDLDTETNEWVSWLRNGKELVRHKDRAEVVRLEHEILAVWQLKGMKIPGDHIGSHLIWFLRRRWQALLKLLK